MVYGLIEEEIRSQVPWDEKRREACVPFEFVVRLHWLEGHEFRDCKCLGGFTIEIQSEKVFHIFGNNLKIRPIRPTEITGYITPMETFDLTPYL